MACIGFFRRFLLAGPAFLLLLKATPLPAAACCSAIPLTTAAMPAPSVPTRPLVFWPLNATKVRPKSAAQSQQFDYLLRHHWWLMGSVHTVPTGRPLTAETSYADRAIFSQAGLGVGYMVSPTLRAISNWNTGLNATSVSRGGQLTVGVTWRY